MTEDAGASTPTESFNTFWLKGLGWGLLAGLALFAIVFGIAVAPMEVSQIVNRFVFWILGLVYASIMAIILVIVPIGPAAALFGWPLYRAGVRSRWAYAAAGAAAAMTAPLLIAVVSRTTTPPLINLSDLLVFRMDSSAVIIFAWFALAGAFGGFMAARSYTRQHRRISKPA